MPRLLHRRRRPVVRSRPVDDRRAGVRRGVRHGAHAQALPPHAPAARAAAAEHRRRRDDAVTRYVGAARAARSTRTPPRRRRSGDAVQRRAARRGEDGARAVHGRVRPRRALHGPRRRRPGELRDGGGAPEGRLRRQPRRHGRVQEEAVRLPGVAAVRPEPRRPKQDHARRLALEPRADADTAAVAVAVAGDLDDAIVAHSLLGLKMRWLLHRSNLMHGQIYWIYTCFALWLANVRRNFA